MKQVILLRIFIFLLPAYILLAPLKLSAAEPGDLYPAVNHLLTYMESAEKDHLNLDVIPRILDFIEKPKTTGETASLWEYKGAVSDYYEFSVNRSLEEVLDLAYNPDLPNNLTAPSSLRRSRWNKVNDQNMPLPRLSDKLNHLEEPVIIKGVEFIENAPDAFSGAYYAYNADRLLILIRHKGRPALVSVSKQKGSSEVGRKGLILGNDDEWNYIYSGKKGTTLRGTGWADTYIYDSASIMVYYESDTSPVQVKCAVFKWLNAGWMGMNFVKPAHIRKGIERFAKDFREVVESPSLADTESLAKMYQNLCALPLDELKAKTTEYYNKKIISRFQAEDSRYKKMIKKLFKKDRYVNGLTRHEMEALVSIEYLKYKLGKSDSVESDCFPASLAD